MTLHEPAVETEPGPCPRCGGEFSVRASRTLLERVLSLVYVYPYRCQLCRHRFRAMRWGVRYERVERREYERLPTEIPVRLMWGDAGGGGLLSELSIAGATVKTDAPIELGDVVRLNFTSSGEDVELTVNVSLVRSRRAGEVGVQFTEVASEHEQRLAALVRDLLERMARR